MPRGSRSATPVGEAAAVVATPVAEAAKVESAPVAAKEQPKSPIHSRKVVIGTGFSIDDMLALDTEGVDLMFEQTDKFLPLEDSVVSQLSSINRTRYSMSREFHDTWRGDEHADFVARFKVDKQMLGSASDKLTVQPPAGMHVRWFRPDRIAEGRAKGYKILSADEISTYLGPTNGHHEIGRLGQTELVAMGIPEVLYKERLKAKTRKNLEQAGSYEGSALSEMRGSGVEPFQVVDEAQDRRHRWSDISPGE